MDWSYLAGFFDGEGSAGPHRKTQTKVLKDGTVHHYGNSYLEADILQKDRTLLVEIAKFLEKEGIKSHIYTHNSSNSSFVPGAMYYKLNVCGKDNFEQFWKKLSPLLLSKRYKVG